MSMKDLREFIDRHNAAAAGLAALGAALDAKASGVALEEPIGGRVADLLAALGVGADALSGLSGSEAEALLAEIRSMSALESKLLYAKTRTVGWVHTEPEILQGIGATSAGFVQPLAQNVVPQLEGLADRLASRGACFLDVGTGVAGLAIAAARRWPSLSIVGIDPWQPALALARENVERASLGERIELREQRAEDLADEAQFDLAWVPAVFMPAKVLSRACERVLRAMRPGGWVLFNAINGSFEREGAALWRLRMAMFGDSAMPAAAAEELLRAAGFVDVVTLCSPPTMFLKLVAGRRSTT